MTVSKKFQEALRRLFLTQAGYPKSQGEARYRSEQIGEYERHLGNLCPDDVVAAIDELISTADGWIYISAIKRKVAERQRRRMGAVCVSWHGMHEPVVRPEVLDAVAARATHHQGQTMKHGTCPRSVREDGGIRSCGRPWSYTAVIVRMHQRLDQPVLCERCTSTYLAEQRKSKMARLTRGRRRLRAWSALHPPSAKEIAELRGSGLDDEVNKRLIELGLYSRRNEVSR